MAQAHWCTALTGPAIVQKPSCRRLGRLRTATGMAEELPGFIPRVLRLDDMKRRHVARYKGDEFGSIPEGKRLDDRRSFQQLAIEAMQNKAIQH